MLDDPWISGPAIIGLLIIAFTNIPVLRFWEHRSPSIDGVYQSNEQQIVTEGRLVIGHPLNSIPQNVTAQLICKNAEHGYQRGDTFLCSPGELTIDVMSDEINLDIRGPREQIMLPGKAYLGGSNRQALTNKNWRIKFIASTN